MTIKFTCKNCGSETFKTRTKPQSLDDFNGAVCSKCGAAITQNDIRKQAAEIADKIARDAFRKAGLK